MFSRSSDYDLMIHLKRISKPKHTRIKFDLEKLKDPNVLKNVQAKIGETFALLPS